MIHPQASNEEDVQEKTGSAVCAVNLKDVGLWPRHISNDTRIFLVRQGALVVQRLDSDFGKMLRNGVSTKGKTRQLTREWFF